MKATSWLGASRSCALVLLFAEVAGCASLAPYWPWGKEQPEPPEPVKELRMEPAAGSTVAATVDGIEQVWVRNTLVLHLRNVAASGAVILRPGEGRSWPVRLGFRVPPGRMGTLEVRGAQRVAFPLATEGSAEIELRLAPGVYRAGTERIELQWGPAAP